MRILSALVIVSVALGLTVIGPASASAEHNFVGVKGCKMCHLAASKGAQFKQWESTRHAKAYETLASDEAKAIASEKGIADPQQSADCLKCHVTGYGLDASRYESTYKMEDGVGCESCHGPGKDYKKKEIMKDVEQAKANGLIMPTEEGCLKCHNEESPTYKPFNFEERVEKIAHPMPEK